MEMRMIIRFLICSPHARDSGIIWICDENISAMDPYNGQVDHHTNVIIVRMRFEIHDLHHQIHYYIYVDI